MEKITMKTPLVEIDGDEMTRILWQMIKEKLILPFVALKTEYYDLSLLNRNDTDDRVTREAGEAAVRLGVAVKCATITPNKKRMEEYPQLKKLYPSPNATIRSIMGGTIFRSPITVDFVEPAVRSWQKPITIARHAFGDIYKATELATAEPGECSLVFRSESGEEKVLSVQKVNEPAVWLGQFNLESSIRSFARACFRYAIDSRQDLWFCAKDTISKTYDGTFRAIFEEEYEACREEFERLGLRYFYTLIDDAIARVMRSPGGFIWACKNYDGDVMSDMISSAYSSIAMMTSVLVTPDGKYEFEAAHGTVTKHYYRYLKGEKTSTNPVAMIFAWSGALKKRGELDSLPRLVAFGEALEQACRNTLNSGKMTGDLASMAKPEFSVSVLDSEEFLDAVAEELSGILNN